MRSIFTIFAVSLTVSATVANPLGYEITWTENTPGLAIGAMLAKGTRIALPANARISFIDWTGASPVQRDCAGVYEGAIDGCVAGRGLGDRLAPGGARSIR